MVRKGSPVRVRQRASETVLQRGFLVFGPARVTTSRSNGSGRRFGADTGMALTSAVWAPLIGVAPQARSPVRRTAGQPVGNASWTTTTSPMTKRPAGRHRPGGRVGGEARSRRKSRSRTRLRTRPGTAGFWFRADLRDGARNRATLSHFVQPGRALPYRGASLHASARARAVVGLDDEIHTVFDRRCGWGRHVRARSRRVWLARAAKGQKGPPTSAAGGP